MQISQGPVGGVSNKGVPDLGTDLNLSVLFCPFRDFPDSQGEFPERVRNTIRTFPDKSGKPLVWKSPGSLLSNQKLSGICFAIVSSTTVSSSILCTLVAVVTSPLRLHIL